MGADTQEFEKLNKHIKNITSPQLRKLEFKRRNLYRQYYVDGLKQWRKAKKKEYENAIRRLTPQEVIKVHKKVNEKIAGGMINKFRYFNCNS
jgi:predicted Zn-dependent peptidase